MDGGLLAIIIKNIVVPEIASIIRSHHNATGQMPTNEEVLAALQLDSARYIAAADDFLKRTA